MATQTCPIAIDSPYGELLSWLNVDCDCADALAAERLDCLRTGVVRVLTRFEGLEVQHEWFSL